MKKRKITWASGFIMACMLISSSFLFSSYHTKKVVDDVWKMIGISRQTGTEGIKNSFFNGYLLVKSPAQGAAFGFFGQFVKGFLPAIFYRYCFIV